MEGAERPSPREHAVAGPGEVTAAARPVPTRPWIGRMTYLAAADVLALQRMVGNRAVAAMVSSRGRALQRKPRIEGHDKWEAQALQVNLEKTVRARGYNYSNRLWGIVIRAFGYAGRDLKEEDRAIVAAISHGDYPQWDDFVDALAEHRAISARIPSKQSKMRAVTLARPKWTEQIENMREQRKAAGKKDEAVRHIVPSHVLGYAIEKWNPSRADVEEWLTKVPPGAKVGIDQPKRSPAIAWRQYAFAIVHNHAGNLWWGGSTDNSAIGFMAPHLESASRRLQALGSLAADGPEKHRADLLEGVTDVGQQLLDLGNNMAARLGPLADRFQQLTKAVQGIVMPISVAIHEERRTPGEGLSLLIEAVDDIFDQTEFDPPEAKPEEFKAARKIYDDLVKGDAAGIPAVLIGFLNITSPGSIGSSSGAAADTGGAGGSESDSETARNGGAGSGDDEPGSDRAAESAREDESGSEREDESGSEDERKGDSPVAHRTRSRTRSKTL